MIAKKIQSKTIKSKFAHIHSLYNYINDEKKTTTRGTLNISSDTDAAIIAEIADRAEECTRSKNPTVHWILSLAENEHFGTRTEQIVQDFLRELHYEDCQCCYAIHSNTSHEHIHLMINRVLKDSKKCVGQENDIYRANEAVARIQHKYSFSAKGHERYVAHDDGKYIRAIYTNDTKSIPPNAAEREIRHGEKSAISTAQEKIKHILETAKSWTELHKKIAQQGATYAKKGGGAVIKIHYEDNTIEIKASSLAKKCALKQIEKRIGPFIEPQNNTISPATKEPIDGITNEILNKYKAYKNNTSQKNNEIKSKKEDEKKLENKKIDEIKKEQTKIKNQIDELDENLSLKQAMLTAYNNHFKQKIKDIKTETKTKIDEIATKKEKIQTFNEWIKNNDIKIQNSSTQQNLNLAPPNEEETKKQEQLGNMTDILRADTYYFLGKKAKKRISIRKTTTDNQYTPQELKNNDNIAATIYQSEEYGYRIYCTPISDKYDYIIDDLQNIYRIQKTNNYVLDKIITTLNRCTTSRHHILTQFLLPKLNQIKHDQNNNKKLCEYAERMYNYHMRIKAIHDKLYDAHKKDILRIYNNNIDKDKLDLLIATRMRATYHKQTNIYNTIISKNNNAKTIITQAFGEIGNKTIRQFKNFIKKWKWLENTMVNNWYLYRNRFTNQKQNKYIYQVQETENNFDINMTT